MNALNFEETGGGIHGVPNVADLGLLATGFENLAKGQANQNGLNFGGPSGGLHGAQNILDLTGFGNLAEGPTNQNALIPCEKGAMVAKEDERWWINQGNRIGRWINRCIRISCWICWRIHRGYSDSKISLLNRI
ncbi:hypothetical protein GQ457_17G026760 [Hibiscus cannabinus]